MGQLLSNLANGSLVKLAENSKPTKFIKLDNDHYGTGTGVTLIRKDAFSEIAWNASDGNGYKNRYNRALAKAQTLAAGGDFSGYKALGYTDQEIAGLKSAYNKAQASARSGGSKERRLKRQRGRVRRNVQGGHPQRGRRIRLAAVRWVQ